MGLSFEGRRQTVTTNDTGSAKTWSESENIVSRKPIRVSPVQSGYFEGKTIVFAVEAHVTI